MLTLKTTVALNRHIKQFRNGHKMTIANLPPDSHISSANEPSTPLHHTCRTEEEYKHLTEIDNCYGMTGGIYENRKLGWYGILVNDIVVYQQYVVMHNWKISDQHNTVIRLYKILDPSLSAWEIGKISLSFWVSVFSWWEW